MAGAGAVCLLLTAGCEEEAIRTYTVSKSAQPSAGARVAPAPAAAENGPQQQPPQPQHRELRWSLPDGWHETTNTSAMRLATLHANHAGPESEAVEVAISRLQGQGGGVMPNINRWRGQLGLDPLTADQLAQEVEMFRGPDGEFLLVIDIAGTPEPAEDADAAPAPERILAAIFHADGDTWFAKMQDAPDRLEPHRGAFVRFVRSFHRHHHPHEPGGTAPAAGAVDPRAPIAYDVPEGWQRDPRPSPMALAVFLVEGEAGTARFTVTRLGPDAGSELANVNRWRGQLGLPPVEGMSGQPSETVALSDGTPATVIALAGHEEGGDPAGMRVAWAQRDDATWFFKMTGPPELIEAQTRPFRGFLESVRFDGDKR